jgi:hypothetical protein
MFRGNKAMVNFNGYGSQMWRNYMILHVIYVITLTATHNFDPYPIYMLK